MINIAILGALGKMGKRIYALAQEDKALKIISLLERPDHPELGKDCNGLIVTSDPSALNRADVVIDFTLAESVEKNIESALKANIKMVIGTTGLSASQVQKIEQASKKIPIVFSSNMSVGVNLLFKLAQDLGQRLGPNYDTRIIEAHHIHKKDAPSGTAKTLAKIIETAKGEAIENIQSIREGEIIGNHDVIFESSVDTLTISHHAKTRDIFVEGALLAAKFIQCQPPGLFSMQDVLGLK